MSNQNGRRRVNVEELVNQGEEENLSPIEVDIFTLVQSVSHNVTLLKAVWPAIVFGNFNLFAAFGAPEGDQWLVTLVAETEQ